MKVLFLLCAFLPLIFASISSESDIEWVPCPLVEGLMAECALIPVPADYDKPFGEQFKVFVKRYNPHKNATNQIWMLPGGPGQMPAVFDPAAALLSPMTWGNFEIVYLDFRGIGHKSTNLVCPDAENARSEGGFFITENEKTDCARHLQEEWGERLNLFTVTNMARDVHYVAQKIRGEKKLWLYGMSFGTVIANRLAVLYPDAWEGIILDSVVPDDERFTVPNTNPQTMYLKRLLNHCANDSFCSHAIASSGLSAPALLDAAFDNLPKCLDARGQPILRQPELRQILGNADSFAPILVPLLYRVHRCNEDDKRLLSHAGRLLTAPRYFKEYREGSWRPLGIHVYYSEYWTSKSYKDQFEFATYGPGKYASYFKWHHQYATQAAWPKYTPDEYSRRMMRTRAHVLLLNGDMDPWTPDTQALWLHKRIQAPWKKTVIIPHAGHETIFQPLGQELPCGFNILLSFLNSGGRSIDTSCTRTTQGVDFRAYKEISEIVLGVEDPYEGKLP